MATPERIKQLFHAALECEASERPRFLAAACGEDTALRQEIESLIWPPAQHPDFLQNPPFELSAVAVAIQVLDDTEEPPIEGQHIGHYRLVREIGRGGMGAVYLAQRDDGHYDQKVAVKLIKRGMDSEEVLRRFYRERQILANLSHPYISRLLDGGTSDDGRPFFVMEYVEGKAISDYANAHKLSINERLTMMLAVCAAVEHAHQHKVIHRDLKPGNILITADGTPKLLDFGIAKLLDSEQHGEFATVTGGAIRLYTPEYASPEQLRGLTLTAASDVYSLGVVMYELLTGRLPYDLKSRAPQEIIEAVIGREPEKPSVAVSRPSSGPNGNAAGGKSGLAIVKGSDNGPTKSRQRELRGDLDKIVLTALRKEPERRYGSVEAFAEEIRRHLQGLPIMARRDALTYRGERFFKRHKVPALSALAAALLFLILGLLLGNVFVTRPNPRESIAVLPLVNVNNNAGLDQLSDGITDSLIDSLSRVPGLAVPRHQSVFRFKGTRDPQAAGHALKVETVLNGTITSHGENLSINLSLIDTKSAQTIWNKQYDGAWSNLLNMQEQIAEDVSRKLQPEAAAEFGTRLAKRRTENIEAYRLYLMGRYFWNQRTYESFLKGIEYFRAATQKDPNYALAYSGLADCYGLLGAYMLLPPDEAFTSARAAALKAIELDEGLAQGHVSLALTLWLYDWDWARADAEFRRAIELDPRYVTAHHWRGLFLGEMARFDEAIAEMQQALVYEPISPPVLADFGRVYFWARRYPEALEKYHKAREIAPEFDAYQVEADQLYEYLAYQKNYSTYEKLGWFMGRDRRAYLTNRKEAMRLAQRRTTGSSLDRAQIYAALGEKDKALADLNDAIRRRDHRMTQLKVNPSLDPLRSDPRFIDLLGRLNLGQ